MTLRGVPVLQYDGLGISLPGDVDDRLASHWVTPVGLGRQLGLIREFGHRVVRLYDAWARGEEEWPARSPVVLTFDDGRAADYEVAFPLLLAAGVRAEFFINTATIGQLGYLTWSRIAEMQRAGMSFQSHSHDHVPLPALPARQLSNELRISKRLIEDRVGRAVDFLAAPHGLVDRRVVEGLPFACGVNPRAGRDADVTRQAATPRRVLVVGGGPAGTELARLSGARSATAHPAPRRSRALRGPARALGRMGEQLEGLVVIAATDGTGPCR